MAQVSTVGIDVLARLYADANAFLVDAWVG
jgi:hypothetical protein